MEDLQAYRSFSTYSSFTTFLGGPRYGGSEHCRFKQEVQLAGC